MDSYHPIESIPAFVACQDVVTGTVVTGGLVEVGSVLGRQHERDAKRLGMVYRVVLGPLIMPFEAGSRSGQNFGDFGLEARRPFLAKYRSDIHESAEQLKVYYTGEWQTNSNIKQTKAMTASARAPLMSQIHDPKRLQFTPAVPETTLKPNNVPSGMLSLEPLLAMSPEPASPPDKISYSGLSSGTSGPATIAATQFVAGSSRAQEPDAVIPMSQLQPSPASSQNTILKELSRKRVDDSIAISQPAAKKPRQGQTCRKCYILTCMGKDFGPIQPMLVVE
ncbi:hypothetical protein B0H10DRAFT_1938098 [Mycena sp. CBHHK59/15]|nr:hypothetical protein B0H10DRAFT_1938098 [Mycena sp. CBHHK59/15]